MKYNPHTKGLTLTIHDASRAANDLLAAIHYTRKLNGLPLEGYDSQVKANANADDTAEWCILKAADALSIDLGANRPGQLDVRKFA